MGLMTLISYPHILVNLATEGRNYFERSILCSKLSPNCYPVKALGIWETNFNVLRKVVKNNQIGANYDILL